MQLTFKSAFLCFNATITKESASISTWNQKDYSGSFKHRVLSNDMFKLARFVVLNQRLGHGQSLIK